MERPDLVHAARLTSSACALLLACGCKGPGSVSPDPLPVRQPEIQAVSAPAETAPRPDDEAHTEQFEVSWTTGQAPFTVRWDLEAPLADPAPAVLNTRTASLDLALVGGSARISGSGTVTVTDALGQVDSAPFTYVVYAAP